MKEGATTQQPESFLVRERESPDPHGPASETQTRCVACACSFRIRVSLSHCLVPKVPREMTSASCSWQRRPQRSTLWEHPCRRQACETGAWLTSESMACRWRQDAVPVPVSDAALHSGAAYPSEVIMSRCHGRGENFA